MVLRGRAAGKPRYRRAMADDSTATLDRVDWQLLEHLQRDGRAAVAELDRTQELLECHHVTGDDCFVIKVAARSMRHLEELAGRLATLGSVTTSVVYSSPLVSRVITQPQP